MMKLPKDKHFGMMIDKGTHYKLHYIAEYEGRSGNSMVLYWIRRGIREFENEHGKIEVPENKEPDDKGSPAG